ncbi:MAG: hypothetical protein CMO16_03160 [Thaumarchaeota archaeon]|nr:hypothetical protein [Nitrososphaerota archaeon]
MSVHKPIFRRTLRDYERNDVINKFSGLLTKKAPGLLESVRRDKLVRESDGEGRFHADSNDFWKGNRELVGNGLSDLQLIATITHNAEMAKMFSLIKWDGTYRGKEQKLNNEYYDSYSTESHKTDLSILLKSVLQPHPTSYDDNLTDAIYGKYRKSDLLWRMELISEIVKECCFFLEAYEILSSQLHKEELNRFQNMINSEINILRNKRDDSPAQNESDGLSGL